MLPAADPYCIIDVCPGIEDDQCAICLQTMVGPTVFPADGCEHVYCAECLCVLQAHASPPTRPMACQQCRRQARRPVAARALDAARNAFEFSFCWGGRTVPGVFLFVQRTGLPWHWFAIGGILFMAIWVAVEVISSELWRISTGLWRTSRELWRRWANNSVSKTFQRESEREVGRDCRPSYKLCPRVRVEISSSALPALC